MATVALLGVAAASGGTLFGTGVAAGLASVAAFSAASYLDSQFIYPELFDTGQKFTGARLDELRVQLASEGSPVNFILGPQNRVAGTVIWLGDLVEEVITEDVGGGSGGGGGGSSTTYEYYISVAVAIGEGELSSMKAVMADGEFIFDGSSTPAEDLTRYESIEFFNGSADQMPSAVIQAAEGVENTPAYRGTSYVLIENYFLTATGNRLPNFNMTVGAQESLSAAGALAIVLRRGGLDDTQFDVSGVSGCLLGVSVAGPQPPAQLIELLMLVHDVLVREVNGVLIFFDRGDSEVVFVDWDDVGAHSRGDDFSKGISTTDVDTEDLDTEIDLQFVDPANNLQTGSVSRVKADSPAQNVANIDVPVTLTGEQALEIAQRQLWRPEAERKLFALSLPFRYLNITEGDVLVITPPGQRTLQILVTSATRGANFQMDVEGTSQEEQTLTAEELEFLLPNGGGGLDNSPPVFVPSNDFATTILDIPALRPQDVDNPVVYYGVSSGNQATLFRGGTLFVGESAGGNYAQLSNFTVESVAGFATSSLPEGKTGGFYWDMESEVVVQINSGSLTSESLIAVQNGANRAMLGDELIGFSNAVLMDTAPTRYILSGLLRGLRGTESAMPRHISNEPFILLSSGTIYPLTLREEDIGTTTFFKGVSLGGSVAETPETEHTYLGNSIRPFPPCDVRGSRNASNDLTVTWKRRTRSFVRTLELREIPLLEQAERYRVEVLDTLTGGVSFVVGTFEFGPERTFTYTASQQVDAGLTPGSSVLLALYQLADDDTPSLPRSITL